MVVWKDELPGRSVWIKVSTWSKDSLLPIAICDTADGQQLVSVNL